MGTLNLVIMLWLAALSSVVAVVAAQAKEPAPVTQGQLKGEIKSSVESAQETLREEIKQSQKKTEAQISGALEKIKSLEKKVNDAPSWWLPIMISVSLGGFLGLIFSRIAVNLDRNKGDAEKKFARVSFKTLKDSLQSYLTKYATQIAIAETIVDNVMESSLLTPWSDSDEKDSTYFVEKEFMDNVKKELSVSATELNFHKEGKRYTKTLAELFKQHQRQTQELNRCLTQPASRRPGPNRHRRCLGTAPQFPAPLV